MIVVLAVRTYAVWNKDKRVGIGLALLLGLCQIPNGIIAERFIQGLDCGYYFDFFPFLCAAFMLADAKSPLLVIPNPYPEIYRGCVALGGTNLIFVNWAVFAVVEGGTLTTRLKRVLAHWYRNYVVALGLMVISALRTC